LRRIASSLILTLLFLGLFGFAFTVQKAKASSDATYINPIYIESDGSISPSTAPIPNVNNATYTLTSSVNDSSIVVERDNIVIDGTNHTVLGQILPNSVGIDLTERNNVTLRNIEISSFFWAVLCENSSSTTISENTETQSTYGIVYVYSLNCSIVNNHISNNTYGLLVVNCVNFRLRENSMTNNTYNFGLYGTMLPGNEPPKYWANDVDSSNTADGKHIYYLINGKDATLDSSDLPNAACLTLINSTGVTAKNMNFSDNYCGLTLVNCNETRVENISSVSNYAGIGIYSSYNVTIQNSFVEKNYDSGIFLGFCNHCAIISNTVQNHTAKMGSWTVGLLGSPGIELSFSNNTQVISNNALNNVVGIMLWLNSYNATVATNNITGNSVGIASGYMANLPIPANTVNNDSFIRNSITNNSYGIELYSSLGNSINRNNVTNNTYGFSLERSNDTSFFGNDVSMNKKGGINLEFSSNCIISRNSITNNFYGVSLDFSSEAIVSGNIITSNLYGVDLMSYSDYNKISGNNITANIAYGIGLSASSGNTFYHNNFVGNAQQVASNDSFNTWDDGYPSGGNYWSNYSSVDQKSGSSQNLTDSDGIGDSPYVIDANNADRYPLAALFNTLDVGTWEGTAYNVDTVSNSIIGNFSFNPTAKTLSFNATSATGTVGFCRVAIPLQLMNCSDLDDWVVKVNGTQLSPPNLNITIDANYTYIYFNYTPSVEQVQITSTAAIPEFQPLRLLPLFMIITLLGAIAFKKRVTKTRN
jgi:parallel beta-helix repeat protein